MRFRWSGIITVFSVVMLLCSPISTPAQGGKTELVISHHSPEGENDGQVQVQVLFNKPVVPLGTLDDPARKEVLSHFRITPNVEGTFRLLGTNAVVFEPKHHLTLATEYRVIVTKGIKAVDGSILKSDLEWTFRTPGPRIQFINPSGTDHAVPDQQIYIISNQALDIASLKEHIRFSESHLLGKDEPVAYDMTASKENRPESEELGMERQAYRYDVKQRRPLKLDTKYALTVDAGVRAQEGNLTTPSAASASFKTYGSFRFTRINSSDDPYNNLNPSYALIFSNGVSQEEMDKGVKLKAGEKATLTQKVLGFLSKVTKGREKRAALRSSEASLFFAGQGASVGINNALLNPDTDYELSILKDLTDIYGQKLENPQDVRFHSGNLQAALVARSGMYVISKKVDAVLPVGLQAVEKLYSKIVGLTAADLLTVDDLHNNLDGLRQKSKGDYAALPGVKERNKPARQDIDLKPRFNQDGFGAVLYDFYAPEEARRWNRYHNGNEQMHHTGLIFRTDLGVHLKISPREGLLLANSLTTGNAVSGVKVSIYRQENKATPCATGVTDATGVWALGEKEMLACTRRKIENKVLNEEAPAEGDENDEAYEPRYYGDARPPKLSLVASKGADWTFLQAQGEGNPPVWNFGVTPAWEAERPIAAGTIFSDRQIYRLGETVELKGVARYLSYGELKKEAGAEYEIELRDPHGARSKLAPVKVSEYGTFHISLPIKKNQPLGHYTITATSKEKKLSYHGGFQVAQFRAPDFKAQVTPEKNLVIAGEDLKAEVKAEYYFGAPMGGAQTSWNVTRRRTIFWPAGWEGISFGIPDWIDREGQGAEPSVNVTSKVLNLDRDGKVTLNVPVPKGDVARPMMYSFDVEVKDPSEQTVGASATATVLPYPVIAGMKISDWFGEAKKPLAVSVVAVDPDGKPKQGTPMVVKLIKRDWHAVRKVIRPGQEATETQMVDTEVGACEVASGIKPVTCTVTPPAAGYYIVHAGFKDRPNTGTEARLTFYASGREMVGWSGTEYDRVEVLLDKNKYAPGDTARALIKSPYPASEMLFTVEREKFFLKKRQATEGGAIIVEFKVTKYMIPNAYVGVALIRKGAPASGQEPEDDHQFKVGYAPFGVSAEEKRLQVQVTPEKQNARPAQELNVEFRVKDQSGKPASGELVVMVVDEAILALTGYTPPDLVSVIYPHRGLSMRISDNRRFLLHQQKFSEKGNDGGGGDVASAVAIRQIFQNLAYYNPSLITGPDGKASIKFKLPDNLTQWRIMAVAVTKDDHFGDGKAGVTVSLPLVSRPVVPRFTRLGDRFKAGVTVQVSGDAGGAVTVSASLPEKDSAILFTGDEKETKRTVQVKPGETRKILFPYAAKTAGSAPLRFTAHFEGKDKDGKPLLHDDAVQVTLAVQDLPPTETTVAVGETDKESREKLNVPPSGIRKDTGGLSISLASTALSQLDEGARYLVAYPYGCLEQTASLLLPLMEIQELSKTFRFDLQSTKPIPEVIKANLAKVLSLQNPDGGFRYWSSDRESDPWLSPYIAKLLSRAEELHYEVPQETKDKLGKYLKESLRNIPWYMHLCSWRCVAYYRLNILMGMRYLGLSDESYYQDYYSRRKDLGLDAHIRLDWLLSQLPKWKEQSATLFEEIKKGMFITAATAHIEDRSELPGSWWWMTSPVINTSQALDLFLVREPNNPFVAKMARYILNARKNGRWRYTYENAAALDALLMVLKKKETTAPDYMVTVLLSGKKVLEAERKGYDTKLVEGRVEAKDLPVGLSDLSIRKKGKGALYYTMRYSYKLLGPQPPRQEGFYVERKIARFDPARATTAERESLKDIPLGQVAMVELTVIVPQAWYRFVVDDPLPAGLEPIDTSLKTTSKRYEEWEQEQGRNLSGHGWSYYYNPFNHVERHDEGVKLFADEIPAGVYHYKYMARATTPGVFELPGTSASLMYEPEQFGRGAEGTFSVTE